MTPAARIQHAVTTAAEAGAPRVRLVDTIALACGSSPSTVRIWLRMAPDAPVPIHRTSPPTDAAADAAVSAVVRVCRHVAAELHEAAGAVRARPETITR